MQKLLRIRDVLETTGLSRSGLYERIVKGSFPRPVNLGARCVAWVAGEVDAWVNERIMQSRTNQEKRV